MPPKSKAKSPKLTPLQVSLKHGFRSGLEGRVAAELEAAGVAYDYETIKIPFVQPAKKRTYCPDYWLPNGIVVETKGRFLSEDRQKHLWVREQHPLMDLRFVFSSSKTRITPRSTTTYADWCHKNGFQFADKSIPQAWVDEPKKETYKWN